MKNEPTSTEPTSSDAAAEAMKEVRESGTKTRRARALRSVGAEYRPPSAATLRERAQAELSALLTRPEIRSALRHCEHMQLVHDSFVRKLAGGSQAVTTDELSAQIERLATSQRSVFDLAQQYPILLGHPGVPTVRP